MHEESPTRPQYISAQQLREITASVAAAVKDDSAWKSQVLTGVKVLEVRFDNQEEQFAEFRREFAAHKAEDREGFKELNQGVNTNSVSIAKILGAATLGAATIALLVWGLNRAFPAQPYYQPPAQQQRSAN